MISLFVYAFLIIPIFFACLAFITNWITDNKPKWRPVSSIVSGFISAYAASFVLDMVIQNIYGNLTFRNILLPLISWTLIFMSLFYVSKQFATRWTQLSISFFVLGAIVLFAAKVGHSYNLYIGIILILIGLLSKMLKIWKH